jgi:hypothetical protein
VSFSCQEFAKSFEKIMELHPYSGARSGSIYLGRLENQA